jgi:hypothetical protein
MADPPWAAVNISSWANVEINLAIIIACIPTLRPLVAKFCPRLVEPPRGESDVDGYNRPPTISSPARSDEMRQAGGGREGYNISRA